MKTPENNLDKFATQLCPFCGKLTMIAVMDNEKLTTFHCDSCDNYRWVHK